MEALLATLWTLKQEFFSFWPRAGKQNQLIKKNFLLLLDVRGLPAAVLSFSTYKFNATLKEERYLCCEEYQLLRHCIRQWDQTN